MKQDISMTELQEEANLFLEAGRRYWNVMQQTKIGGAVVWIKDTEGFGCIFTRGEYAEQLLTNIHRLGPTYYFGGMGEELQ